MTHSAAVSTTPFYDGQVRFPMLALNCLLALAATPPPVLTVCELSKDYPRLHNRQVTVRGVYYEGLREQCPQKCATGPWPSFINLTGGDDAAWDALHTTEREVEAKAKKTGQRFEIWATFVGRLEARTTRSPLGPCDRAALGGYGHLGAYPAELVVTAIRDIQVKVNPQSPYDYGNLYHGAR